MSYLFPFLTNYWTVTWHPHATSFCNQQNNILLELAAGSDPIAVCAISTIILLVLYQFLILVLINLRIDDVFVSIVFGAF